MKCRKCGSVKHRNKQGRLWCSPCNTITCKNWRKDHSEELHVINRRAHLKARYGMTTEEFMYIFDFQGRRCAICKSLEPRGKHTWSIDHEDIAGVGVVVRGILCAPCNIVLGYYELYGIPVGVEFKNYLANPPAGQAMRKKEGRKSTLDGWSLQECAMQ